MFLFVFVFWSFESVGLAQWCKCSFHFVFLFCTVASSFVTKTFHISSFFLHKFACPFHLCLICLHVITLPLKCPHSIWTYHSNVPPKIIILLILTPVYTSVATETSMDKENKHSDDVDKILYHLLYKASHSDILDLTMLALLECLQPCLTHLRHLFIKLIQIYNDFDSAAGSSELAVLIWCKRRDLYQFLSNSLLRYLPFFSFWPGKKIRKSNL